MMLRHCTFLVCTMFVSSGCSRLWGALGEEFEDHIAKRVAARGGIITEPPVNPLAPLTINRLQPSRGNTEGGYEVEIVGLNFLTDFDANATRTVNFGAVAANIVPASVTDSSMRVVVPPATLAGPVQISITEILDDPNDNIEPIAVRHGTLDNGFVYFVRVTISNVTPNRGPTSGGSELTISGTGLIDGTHVQFGTLADIEGTSITPDGTNLSVQAPPLPKDLYAVTVTNLNGSATLTSAFSTWEPVHIDRVIPFAAPLDGAIALSVFGTGFIAGSTAEIATEVLDSVVANAAETQLAANLLSPFSPRSEGPQAVTVQNSNGSDTLNDGFSFYDASDLTPRIVSVSPQTGLINGGREVHILVVGFAPITQVLFGTSVANCTIDNVSMAQLVTCTAPAHTAGTVDVTLTDGATNLVAPAAFNYIELRADVLLPNQGAQAGGTYLQVFGSGFGSDTKVYFADRLATDIVVINSSLLTLRTPPGDVGSADVRVLTQGVEINNPDFFTYFDPADLTYWTSGGPINGAVNVTVMADGLPLKGAFVMIGADPSTTYQGVTDANGQITLSGPDILGPQSVHAAKPGCASFSWIETNAQNLTMRLTSPLFYFQCAPIPPNPGPGPTPQEPATVRGTVRRVKDAYNFGNDTVVVTTTYFNFSTPLPDPGPNTRMINQGPYEIKTRLGDVILIALAGTFDTNNRFVAHAMGFRPFFYAEEGQLYEDIDITIDTPLSRDMHVLFDDAPYNATTGPNTSRAFVYYDFGYQGVHPMANVRVPFDDDVVIKMPVQLPGLLANSPFIVDGGVYSDFGFSLQPPQSEVSIEGLVDTSQPVVLTPMLGFLEQTQPSGGGITTSPPHFEFNLPTTLSPSANFFVVYETAFCINLRWLAVSPATNADFDLPIFPQAIAASNLLTGDYCMDTMGLYKTGSQYDHLDLNDLFAWQSRSVNETFFSTP